MLAEAPRIPIEIRKTVLRDTSTTERGLSALSPAQRLSLIHHVGKSELKKYNQRFNDLLHQQASVGEIMAAREDYLNFSDIVGNVSDECIKETLAELGVQAIDLGRVLYTTYRVGVSESLRDIKSTGTTTIVESGGKAYESDKSIPTFEAVKNATDALLPQSRKLTARKPVEDYVYPLVDVTADDIVSIEAELLTRFYKEKQNSQLASFGSQIRTKELSLLVSCIQRFVYALGEDSMFKGVNQKGQAVLISYDHSTQGSECTFAGLEGSSLFIVKAGYSGESVNGVIPDNMPEQVLNLRPLNNKV